MTTVDSGGPSITLSVSPSAPTIGDAAEIVPAVGSADGGATGLEVKWDDGYDGTWDTPYAAPAPHKVTSATPADLPFKARIRDAAGHVAEAVIWVTFTESHPGSDAGADGGPVGADAGPVRSDAGAGGATPGKSGCGCRVAGAGGERGPLGLLGLLVTAAALGRRRSARVH
jgi:MYXO-CTERM domain-containing protein